MSKNQKSKSESIFQELEKIESGSGYRTTLETQLNETQNLVIVEYSDANGVVYFSAATTYFPKTK